MQSQEAVLPAATKVDPSVGEPSNLAQQQRWSVERSYHANWLAGHSSVSPKPRPDQHLIDPSAAPCTRRCGLNRGFRVAQSVRVIAQYITEGGQYVLS
jgi:hypothetical protein